MRQPRSREGLAPEALDELRRRGELLSEQLHGHPAAEPLVSRDVDAAHAAHREQLLEHIAVREHHDGTTRRTDTVREASRLSAPEGHEDRAAVDRGGGCAPTGGVAGRRCRAAAAPGRWAAEGELLGGEPPESHEVLDGCFDHVALQAGRARHVGTRPAASLDRGQDGRERAWRRRCWLRGWRRTGGGVADMLWIM